MHHPQSQSPCLMQCYILYSCSCLCPPSCHADPPEEFHVKTIALGHLNQQVISKQFVRTITPHHLLAFISAPAGPVSSSPTGMATPVAQSHIVPLKSGHLQLVEGGHLHWSMLIFPSETISYCHTIMLK